MDMLVIRGGTPLRGDVNVSGSKNAALPIMAAALASSAPLTLHNVPDLVDVRTQAAVLRELGVAIDWDGESTYRLQVEDDRPCVAPYELVRRMRASVCVLGPLLAKRGRACVSLPGGCNIGYRPIDLHLKGLAALGADIRIEQGYVIAEASRLHGATINLAGPHGSTVTGTCNVMTAAALARGTTVIDSAACEPEVVDLAECLNRMGAAIEGAGTPRILITGVAELHAAEHHIISDRIEAATLACAGLISGGKITLQGARPENLDAVLEQLWKMGADIDAESDSITIGHRGTLLPARCEASPYPGIPTDVQAQLTAVLTQADGVSRVADRVFPERFLHLPELCRLGADIRREGGAVAIHGQSKLTAANVMASDLRASAALVLAALAAEGESIVRRVYHLDRGYEQLEVKLRQLGADVRRAVDTPADVPEFETLRPGQPSEADNTIPAPHFLSQHRGIQKQLSRDGRPET